MNGILRLTVSMLALAEATVALQAAEPSRPAADFKTVVVPHALPLHGPSSPSLMLGTDAIGDRPAVSLIARPSLPRGLRLDPMTTGQIPNPDAEKAAEEIESGAAAQAAAAESAEKAAGDAGHAEGEEKPASQWASERSPMPFDIIRTIQFLQDQVARGNGRAIQVQAMLLRRFGPVFVAAEPSVWADGRNMRAAVLFVLSGGPPAVLDRLMEEKVVDDAHLPLVKGALAYVRNDLPTAKTLLSGVSTEGMEPGLEAHLNLVLAQLTQLDTPKEAVPHLDRARLLAPGGLIEEAALRMEVLVVDGLGDHATADRLARQYFDRYARSSYSANFEARYAAVVSTRGKTDAPAALATMLDTTERLAAPNKRAIYLGVARRALVEGNFAFAALSADAALKTDGITDADQQRARLYAFAASIGASGTGDPTTALAGIDRAALHPEDTKLLDAAYSVVDGIDRTTVASAPPAGDDTFADSSAVFDRAQQLLNEVSNDLGKGQQ